MTWEQLGMKYHASNAFFLAHLFHKCLQYLITPLRILCRPTTHGTSVVMNAINICFRSKNTRRSRDNMAHLCCFDCYSSRSKLKVALLVFRITVIKCIIYLVIRSLDQLAFTNMWIRLANISILDEKCWNPDATQCFYEFLLNWFTILTENSTRNHRYRKMQL